MAQIKSLKEIADLGFVIAFRFYGRYPETGRSFYHPPCESAERAHAEASAVPVASNERRLSPVRRPGLAAATSLILPSLAAPRLWVFFSSGTPQGLGQFSNQYCGLFRFVIAKPIATFL